MDKKFGAPWHVVVGRAFSYEITTEVSPRDAKIAANMTSHSIHSRSETSCTYSLLGGQLSCSGRCDIGMLTVFPLFRLSNYVRIFLVLILAKMT